MVSGLGQPFWLGAGVRLAVARLQPLGRDMSVDLRGRGRGVAEDLLDAAQVGAALEQVGGRRVPDRVRAASLTAGRPDVAFRRPAAPSGRPRAAGRARCGARSGDRDGRRAPRGRGRPRCARWREPGRPASCPARHRPHRGHPDRDDALLAALAEHPDRAPVQVEAAEVELAQLADPDGRRVEQLEDGDVAQRQRRRVARGPVANSRSARSSQSARTRFISSLRST